MRCFHPWTAYQAEDGGQAVAWEKTGHSVAVTLRCGRCIGCRLSRGQQWTTRLIHEASQHDANCFLTLTQSEDKTTLIYDPVQKFIRALRKKRRAENLKAGNFIEKRIDGQIKKITPTIRYFAVGEYGEKGDRPHFHVLLFGEAFNDRTVWSRLEGGYYLYRSRTLEQLWPHGYSTIGDFTPETAAYCARYVTKKVTGEQADAHYLRVNETTGEETLVEPEFARMSLKPGIGLGWLSKYASDIYPRDHAITRGRKVVPPRTYDKWLEKNRPDLFRATEYEREERRMLYEDKDWNRLAVLEEVAKAATKGKGKL